jgi:hypothetical protein
MIEIASRLNVLDAPGVHLNEPQDVRKCKSRVSTLAQKRAFELDRLQLKLQ